MTVQRDPETSRGLVAAITLLVTYFVATNHLPLGPLNHEHGLDQLASTLVGVLPYALIVVDQLRGPTATSLLLAAGWSLLWLSAQLWQWWLPYLWGATPLHPDLSWYLDGGYDQTLHVLPLREGVVVPDLQHMLLQLGTVVVTSWLARNAYWTRRRTALTAATA